MYVDQTKHGDVCIIKNLIIFFLVLDTLPATDFDLSPLYECNALYRRRLRSTPVYPTMEVLSKTDENIEQIPDFIEDDTEIILLTQLEIRQCLTNSRCNSCIKYQLLIQHFCLLKI